MIFLIFLSLFIVAFYLVQLIELKKFGANVTWPEYLGLIGWVIVVIMSMGYYAK